MRRFIEDNWGLGRIFQNYSYDAIAGSILNMFEFSNKHIHTGSSHLHPRRVNIVISAAASNITSSTASTAISSLFSLCLFAYINKAHRSSQFNIGIDGFYKFRIDVHDSYQNFFLFLFGYSVYPLKW